MDKFEQGLKMYVEEDYTLPQIKRILHIDRGDLSKYIKSKGYQIKDKRQQFNVKEDVFDVIDSEEKAYWLGFLYADGCLTPIKGGKKPRYFIEIGIQASDKEHLEKFNRFLGANWKISYRKKTNSYRISVGNKHLYMGLIDKGCVPNKSLSLTFPNSDQVPTHLIKHFVRGYIDGDGYIGIKSWNTKNGKHYGPRLGITCGNSLFIESLINVMGWRQLSLKKDSRSNAYKTEWNQTKETMEMLKNLYEEANIYLDRKYEKYTELKFAVSNVN